MLPAIDIFMVIGLWWGGLHGPPTTSAPADVVVDLSKHTGRFDGCFVMYDVSASHYVRYKPERCDKRLSPCSTFKIPNSLIALETGVLKGAEHELKWNGVKSWREITNEDHTLRSAFKHSVVWYYQRVAEMVGEKRMQEWLDRIGYGNRDISAGLTQFWLGKSLEISAEEQVAFLLKLQRGELPFSKRTQNIVRDIMVLSGDGDWVLRGKTGTDMHKGKTILGWFVGYLTHGKDVYVFALNIEGRSGASGPHAKRICQGVLEELLPAYREACNKASQQPTTQPASQPASSSMPPAQAG